MNPLNHVAIIMDGNGRWGLKNKSSRNQGHKAGLDTVKKIIKETIEKKKKKIKKKKEVLDQQIDDEINKAEKEIEVLRVSAPDKINKIAIETSSELLEKLIGSGVNSSSISAIVDDLSRRNGDKYYGN